MQTRKLTLTNCKQCTYHYTERTPGSGYAIDYHCAKAGQKIAVYVELPSQEPQDGVFPNFCPLPKGRK